MKYEQFGLVNTKSMFNHAIANHYAIGAFNFYNMETLTAIIGAARTTGSPIILAVSEGALKYMGDNMLMGMIAGAGIYPNEQIALHLDHGHSVDACAHAIDIGFSSVMIDASNLPFDENIALSQTVAEYAHEHGVSVEAELGVLRGHEDENTQSDESLFTNPDDAQEFVSRTGIDSLAVSIGTSHGAYKMKSDNQKLRFDLLDAIMDTLPDFPLVLHGASSIPQQLVNQINENGGQINNAHGIPRDQLCQAASMNICKINIDSDSRLAFTAGIRETLATSPEKFDPRAYLTVARDTVFKNTVDEITNIMNSANRLNQ